MPKTGNYVQRDYQRGSSQKATWADYNKAWNSRRSAALEKSQQLRNLASNFTAIGVQASQANTVFVMQNQSSGQPYASSTAVMARVNVLI